jgi:hypothetical protein
MEKEISMTDPKALISAAAQMDPGLANVIEKYVSEKLKPPEIHPIIDSFAMPDLPEFARFDPMIGTSPGNWINVYTNYARSVAPMSPDLFHESAALWLASVAIARRLVLPMAFGDIYPNLYILWMADTTLFRKSTALTVARKLARDTFPFLLAAQDTTPEAFLSDLSGIQPVNYSTLPLIDQQIWEKGRNFAAQRGWVLDELSGLMAGFGRDYNAGLLESLLSFYDCDPIFKRSTKGSGWVIVKNSYISLLGASTPGAMSSHLSPESLWSSGWWARFAILTAEGRPIWQVTKSMERPPELQAGLKGLFSKLPNNHKWPDSPGELAVTMGDGVLDLWSKYNQALSFDLLRDTLPKQLWGSYGRLPTHALKFAMILAALDWQDDPVPKITLPHMTQALTIAEGWRSSVHRAIDSITESNFTRISKRMIQVISKFPCGVSQRDICRAMRDKKPADIQNALDEMITAGMIEEVPTANNGKKGRPTNKYILAREEL